MLWTLPNDHSPVKFILFLKTSINPLGFANNRFMWFYSIKFIQFTNYFKSDGEGRGEDIYSERNYIS